METKNVKKQKNNSLKIEKGLKTLNSFENEFNGIDVKLAYISLVFGVFATAVAFGIVILIIEIIK